MIARIASLGLPLAAVLLLTAPARAQEAPSGPPAGAQPAPVVVGVPGGCAVVVVNGGCPTTVIVQGSPPPQALPEGPPAAAPVPYYPYPQAYYPPAYYPAPLPPPLPRSRSVFSAKLWAGPTYQKLYDVSIYAADFGVALGAQRGISGWYGTLEGVAGRTTHGLTTYQYWVGGSWEGAIDRVHLGVGIHLGYAGIQRGTSSGSIGGVGIGAYALASVDLYRSEEGHALYVGARITANMMESGMSDAAALWGPSASLGWRY